MTTVPHDPREYPAQVHLMMAGIARLKYGGDEQAAWEAYWHDLETADPLLVRRRPPAVPKTSRRARRTNP